MQVIKFIVYGLVLILISWEILVDFLNNSKYKAFPNYLLKFNGKLLKEDCVYTKNEHCEKTQTCLIQVKG